MEVLIKQFFSQNFLHSFHLFSINTILDYRAIACSPLPPFSYLAGDEIVLLGVKLVSFGECIWGVLAVPLVVDVVGEKVP